MSQDWVRVVAGIVIEEDRVLLGQRTRAQSFSLLWEFPGGKIELGETPARALVREFREELGIEVKAQKIYDHIQYTGREGRPIDVTFMFACRVDGEPRPLEVAAVKWAPINTLDQVEFIPANRDVVQRLQQETLARNEREEKNR